ncbi:flavin-containing monooxygenase [Actinomycetospora sp. CA-084318]|uniref:flavin-containing monooxygenase n=1 Tax=Actinomycetospora sp. CA-084318 TaxID=3239892 RepID=UPI003D9622D6
MTRRVVIIGAGFGGIGAAIELRAHGYTDVTILDAAPGIGGTWLANTYPGAACDVPSHLYSYSFAQRRSWSRLCSPQSEILEYLRTVAREHSVDHLVRPDTKVTACRWDDEATLWRVETEQGDEYTADAVVIATGQLAQPSIPGIPGREDFAGTEFHSAQWDHDHDLTGRKVAVIGTGASAVQFVPAIAPVVGKMSVFQRTGNWFLPRKNMPYPRSVQRLIKVPGVQRLRRWGLKRLYLESLTASIRHPRTVGPVLRLKSQIFMRHQLRDPEVRRKVWPDYTFGCKRVLFSSYWLPALQRDNVEVVTDSVERIEPSGVRTKDGRLHEVDTIIWGTGFRTTSFMFPMEVHGREGRSLRDEWADGPHAHLGMTVPGFPNLFVMYGPNTNTSGGSIIVYLESQARYVRTALQEADRRGAAAAEVRPDVEAASDAEVQSRFEGTAWQACDSWYRDESGRIITNWPGYMVEYEKATERIDPDEYVWLAPGEQKVSS